MAEAEDSLGIEDTAAANESDCLAEGSDIIELLDLALPAIGPLSAVGTDGVGLAEAVLVQAYWLPFFAQALEQISLSESLGACNPEMAAAVADEIGVDQWTNASLRYIMVLTHPLYVDLNPSISAAELEPSISVADLDSSISSTEL